MPDAVIVAAARTAIGTARKGTLVDVSAFDLAKYAVAETLKGYEIATWYGLAGPKNLPRPIVDRLTKEVHAILKEPDVAKRLQDLAAEVSSSTPEQFAAFWKKEIEKYRKIIADAKIEA